MTDSTKQPEGVSVPWLWSVPWLCKQHRAVPPNVIITGINVLHLSPALVIDGVEFRDGNQYAQLQRWLLEAAKQELSQSAAPMEPSAQARSLAHADPQDLCDRIEQERDPDRRRELVFGLAVALGQRSRTPSSEAGEIVEHLQKLAAGDVSQVENIREWITHNLIVGAREQ
ncbi:MAG: hypothetical protein WD042_03055 [Phycisphaeraceae bacterium]